MTPGELKSEYEKRVKDFRTAMDKIVNSFDDELLEMAATMMSNEHRSLQQRQMTLFLMFVGKMAQNNETGRVDGRNQYAAQIASKIKEALGNEIPTMPFI